MKQEREERLLEEAEEEAADDINTVLGYSRYGGTLAGGGIGGGTGGVGTTVGRYSSHRPGRIEMGVGAGMGRDGLHRSPVGAGSVAGTESGMQKKYFTPFHLLAVRFKLCP